MSTLWCSSRTCLIQDVGAPKTAEPGTFLEASVGYNLGYIWGTVGRIMGRIMGSPKRQPQSNQPQNGRASSGGCFGDHAGIWRYEVPGTAVSVMAPDRSPSNYETESLTPEPWTTYGSKGLCGPSKKNSNHLLRFLVPKETGEPCSVDSHTLPTQMNPQS
jgi:hypothetical protein